MIRFHPHCPFGGLITPAMVALVRGIISDQPQAVHRTALDFTGNKVTVGGRDRMALGPIGGGAVKLTDNAEVTNRLGIGEGIETTLSLQLKPQWLGGPVWSLLNAGGVQSFPVLSGIETLMIAVDHDEAGERAATIVNRRWLDAGREVWLREAVEEGADLNDTLEGRHE